MNRKRSTVADVSSNGEPLKIKTAFVVSDSPITKPNFSSREGINSRCRRFDLLFFSVLIRYDRNCGSSGCRSSDGSLAIN